MFVELKIIHYNTLFLRQGLTMVGPQVFQGVLAASEALLKLPARARVWRGGLRVSFGGGLARDPQISA